MESVRTRVARAAAGAGRDLEAEASTHLRSLLLDGETFISYDAATQNGRLVSQTLIDLVEQASQRCGFATRVERILDIGEMIVLVS